MTLNNQWAKDEIKEEILKYLEKNDSENNYKMYGMQQNQS